MSNQYPFKAFVFEGGGTTAFGHLGALEVFREKGALDQIEYFIGSSSGSLVAASLACGASTSQIANILNETDFTKFLDNSFGIFRDSYRLITKYGWNKGQYIEDWFGESLERIISEQGYTIPNPSKITFKEAYELTDKYLVITTTNLTTGEILYMNHETTPDLEIKVAVRRSMSLPFIYLPDTTKEDGLKQCYVDGGLINNYPIYYFDKYLSDPNQTVGFKLMTSSELSEITNPYVDAYNPTYPKHIGDFMMRFFIMIINQNFKIHIPSKDWDRTVKIDTKDFSVVNFNMTDEEKEFLVEQGKKGASDFFQKFI
jgi:NTE family protein